MAINRGPTAVDRRFWWPTAGGYIDQPPVPPPPPTPNGYKVDAPTAVTEGSNTCESVPEAGRSFRNGSFPSPPPPPRARGCLSVAEGVVWGARGLWGAWLRGSAAVWMFHTDVPPPFVVRRLPCSSRMMRKCARRSCQEWRGFAPAFGWPTAVDTQPTEGWRLADGG